MFDALTVQKIEKLQAEDFLKEKEAAYKKQAEQLKADYDARLELAKREIEDKLRKQIEEELRKERAEKKKRKKTTKESEAAMAMEILLKTVQQNGQPSAVSPSPPVKQTESTSDDEDADDDLFPDPELDSIE